MYLEYVPGDLNPADCLSRVDSDWSGRVGTACQEPQVRYKALEAYLDVPSPVWVLGFPKGRRGAATNSLATEHTGRHCDNQRTNTKDIRPRHNTRRTVTIKHTDPSSALGSAEPLRGEIFYTNAQ